MVAIILYDPATPGLEEPEFVATIRDEYITILRLESAGISGFSLFQNTAEVLARSNASCTILCVQEVLTQFIL